MADESENKTCRHPNKKRMRRKDRGENRRKVAKERVVKEKSAARDPKFPVREMKNAVRQADDAVFCWYFCWYLFPSAGDEKSRYQQEVSMPLTDSKVKALYGRARKGETVGKEADGGGLNLQGGKYWRLSYRFAGKQKTLALGVYPGGSL